MIIRPELRALRGDDTPQCDAQAAMRRADAAWRARPEVAEVLAGVAAYAGGSPLDQCPALAALFDESAGIAADFARSFAAMQAQAIAASPLGHAALRHFTDGVLSTLLLAREGNVTLALVAVDGEGLRAQPDPASINFLPAEAWEHVLAGTARAELVECRPAGEGGGELLRRAIALRPGTVLCRDADRRALLLRGVDGCLVSLRLQRRQPQAGPSREHELASGRLVHQAAGNPRDSRIELMMALLGRMERADAAPLMAEVAREQGSPALRWQALRECLGLDTRAGFAALCEIARAPADPLAVPAGALRSQLVETWPELARIEPCPA